MTATLYLRDLGRGPRWYAYDKGGLISSADTKTDLVHRLRVAGWNVREAYS